MSTETKVYDTWEEAGIEIRPNVTSMKTACPVCSHNRKHSRDKCLSISPKEGIANCHNCGTAFVIRSAQQNSSEYKPKEYINPVVRQLPVSKKVIDFFQSRGIEERTLEYFKVTESVEWMYDKEDIKAGETPCINFNYYDSKVLINVKFRASGKRFKMVSGAKLIFYNLDQIKNTEDCAIQEGEIDTMSAYQCNIFNSVSVPNGASKGNQKLEYLDNCIEFFENKKKIIIATDGDEAGNMLRDELVRRFGREKCWTIEYPEGCKDTNEVLLTYGAAAVTKMYREAKPMPLEGIFTGDDVSDSVIGIYRNGYPVGVKVGYPVFDDHWSCRCGEVTIITAIPGSGKSEFTDQLMVRLASRFNFRCGIFSPEQQPTSIHASALISKFIGEPIMGYNKMSELKLNKGLEFINDHFFFMKVNEIDTTIDGILGKAKELVTRKGINILVIDPYNYIEHKIPKGYTETQYISELMSKISNFAKSNVVHVFLIAHPVKIQKDKQTGKYNVATMYDIAGSANFFNKTDNGLSVYRDFETNLVHIYIQKIKFKFIGKVGSASFTYDLPTGRYASEGYNFDNEFERLQLKEKQSDIQFSPTPIKEAPQLTDISKLPIENNFDKPAEKKQPEELKPDPDGKAPF